MQLKKYLMIITTSLLTLVLSNTTFAKVVNMYDEPKTGAKVVGTVDLANGIIPIFTPKTGDWVKIADPRNGNVGWITSADMNSEGTTAFTFTQKNGDGKNQQYQVFQFGNGPKLSNEELQKEVQKFQVQYQAVQQNLQQGIETMMKDLNAITQHNLKLIKDYNLPITMPIVIFPVQNKTPPAQPTQPAPKVQNTAPVQPTQ